MEVEIEKREIHLRWVIVYVTFLMILLISCIKGISLFLLILTFLCGILGIYHFLAYINQKIIFSNEGITFRDFLSQENICSWDDISYKRLKKRVPKKTISGSYYRRKCEIKNEYTFFSEGRKLFILKEEEFLPAAKTIFESAVRNNRVKEDKKIVNGEEVTELKPSLTLLFGYLFMLVMLSFLVLVIFAGLSSSFHEEIFFVNLIFVAFDIYYLVCVIKELEQIVQKVYFIENQGFYKVVFGNNEYYDFKDIDSCIFKRYLSDSDTEYKAILYKNDEKILTITNSNSGFYDFIDEIRNKEIKY